MFEHPKEADGQQPPLGEIAPAPVIKEDDECLKSPAAGVEHRRQWGGGGGAPLVAMLQQKELHNGTSIETGTCIYSIYIVYSIRIYIVYIILYIV